MRNMINCFLSIQNNIAILGIFFFFQDPLDPTRTAIVISSLVAGGVAERGGELLPGDRLVFVNEKYLDSATLAEAVEVLKSVPPGRVSLGICKPLVVRTAFFFLSHSVTCRSGCCILGEKSICMWKAANLPCVHLGYVLGSWQMGSSKA